MSESDLVICPACGCTYSEWQPERAAFVCLDCGATFSEEQAAEAVVDLDRTQEAVAVAVK